MFFKSTTTKIIIYYTIAKGFEGLQGLTLKRLKGHTKPFKIDFENLYPLRVNHQAQTNDDFCNEYKLHLVLAHSMKPFEKALEWITS